jgi:hypothetical protein
VELLVDLLQEDKQRQLTKSAPSQSCGMCEEKIATRRCVQCNGYLCEECVVTSHSKGFMKNHAVVHIIAQDGDDDLFDFSARMKCFEHPEEKLGFYCLDCRTAVCSHCLLLGEHKGHQQTQISGAFETGKETLRAWVEKLHERIRATEDLLTRLHTAESEVDQGSSMQRGTINAEMDHLVQVLEAKRKQLLAKSEIEESGKRQQLQVQMDKTASLRSGTHQLISRSAELLSTPSEHAFLAVVLPLIQDMKKCQSQSIDSAPAVNGSFRPLTTDAQVRALGELDLGVKQTPAAVKVVGNPGSYQGPGVTARGLPGAVAAPRQVAATVQYVHAVPGMDAAPVQFSSATAEIPVQYLSATTGDAYVPAQVPQGVTYVYRQ